MTNMKPKLTTKLRHISRAAPKRVIALVLTFLFAFNAASVLEAFPAYAEGESQTAGESTVQTSEPTASVTNDDLQISGSNSFGKMLATKVNDYQNGGDEDEYTEGYSVIGIEMNGKTSVVEYRAKDDCSLVVAVYDDNGAKMLGSGNTTVAANKQSAEVEISIDEMPQDYLVKAFLVNPANNYPLCDAFSKTFPVIEEPTEDLPELYTPDGDNIAYASEENFYYMNNMVIIVFADDAQQSEIDSVIASINGKAVGKNKYINQYQVEIATHSLDELRDIITQVESNECVLFAHYDEVLENPECSISLNDPWYGDIANDDWNNSDIINGSNWWLKAIEAPGAWEYNDYFSKIKIGIVDDGFDTDHEDLDLSVLNPKFNSKEDHGTHIAGIIGAKDNNGKGITGIVWNKELICYDWEPTNLQGFSLFPRKWSTESFVFAGFINEVEAGAKVINFSLSCSGKFDNPIVYSQEELDEEGRVTSGYMAAMLQSRDFVVVQSAGNAGIDAINSKFWSSITQNNCVDWGKGRASKQNILDRILIVGAVYLTNNQYVNSYYSNGGNQVNIAAPGGNYSKIPEGVDESVAVKKMIYSTIADGYYVHGGTSMAAPMVTGVAAIVWSVNLSFTGKEVAQIVKTCTSENAIENTSPEYDHHATGTPPIVNARLAVEEAIKRTHPAEAVIESGKCGDNITYTLYGDGRLLLSGSGTMWNYDKREDVPWYNSRSNIKVVGFDGNITHIGNRIFGDCSNLTTISIPSTVTSIGDAAFSECTGLTELTILDSVTSIGTAAFSDCRGLTNITVPYFATNIGDFVFGNCSGLTQAIIQSSSPTIKKMMFANCSSLKAVYIPKTVTSVGDSAFFKCDSLTDVYYSGSQTEWNNISISNMNNSALTNATLHCSGTDNGAVIDTGKCGDNITYTLYENGLLELSGSGEMYNRASNSIHWNNRQSQIKKVQFTGNISSIGTYMFSGCRSLTSITIPNSVTSIGDSAFCECSSLENITVPNSVTSIGDSAFYQCHSLKSITIPNSVTSIGAFAFSDCSGLTSITIPDSVTSIGCGAFSDCSSLTSITIPNSVTSIGMSAFEHCSRLTNVTIPNSVTSIGMSAFECCSSLTNITIPNSVTSIDTVAFWACDSLTNINVSEGNNKYSSFDGLLLDKNKTKVIVCPPGKSESITIPDSVTSIGDFAFHECRSLTSITIPNSVTLIDVAAFSRCESLTSITIPNSVASIGSVAFLYCNSLTDVYYTGTQEEWARISISNEGNDYLTNANIHYNSTGPSSSPTPMLSPDVSGTLSATFDNLIPNANYLFVVSKSSDLDNMLDASNLLFIDEKTAGDSGSLTFGYIPREDYEGAVVKIFGPVNPSVTLDKTSATLKKGDKLTLTAMVDQEHSASDVGWASSNTGIATVSDSGEVTAVGFGDVEIIATLGDCAVKCLVSVVPELDFTILGASIRLIEPYGIRFGIQLGKGGDYANVKIVDYGTIMKPTELLDGEDLTLETGNVQKIPAKVIYSENDAMKIYTGVLINIPTTYFDTAISGRGYFIYEDENGVNHTVYTDIVSMSFNDVVNAAYQKYTSLPNPTDAQKEIIARLEVLRAMSVND